MVLIQQISNVELRHQVKASHRQGRSGVNIEGDIPRELKRVFVIPWRFPGKTHPRRWKAFLESVPLGATGYRIFWYVRYQESLQAVVVLAELGSVKA
jgi:hypothetical protein